MVEDTNSNIVPKESQWPCFFLRWIFWTGRFIVKSEPAPVNLALIVLEKMDDQYLQLTRSVGRKVYKKLSRGDSEVWRTISLSIFRDLCLFFLYWLINPFCHCFVNLCCRISWLISRKFCKVCSSVKQFRLRVKLENRCVSE